MGANTDKALRVVLMGGNAKASSTKGAQLSLAALERGMKARFAPSDEVASRKRDMLKNFLAQSFPECLSDGHIDFETLRRTLGDWIEARNERFGLVWPDKAQCMKIIQQPSVATLNPDRAESVNFESTDNIFIEGENLKVLKLMQKMSRSRNAWTSA